MTFREVMEMIGDFSEKKKKKMSRVPEGTVEEFQESERSRS